MSVSYDISLDLRNISCHSETIYAKESTQGLVLNVSVFDNREPFDLTGAQVFILSNNGTYISDENYPFSGTTSGNIATFNLDGVFSGGWTLCSVRIIVGSNVYETQNFQIYSESTPSPSLGNSSSPLFLPTASSTIKGGVKVGNGLSMSGEVLNADVSREEVDNMQDLLTVATRYHYFRGDNPQSSGTGAIIRFTTQTHHTITDVPKVGDIVHLILGSSFVNKSVEVNITGSTSTSVVGRISISSAFTYNTGENVYAICTRTVNQGWEAQCSIIEKSTTLRRLDALELASHTHANLELLNKLSYDDGLKYDGDYVVPEQSDLNALMNEIEQKSSTLALYCDIPDNRTSYVEYTTVRHNNSSGDELTQDEHPQMGDVLVLSFSSWGIPNKPHCITLGTDRYIINNSELFGYPTKTYYYGIVVPYYSTEVYSANYGIDILSTSQYFADTDNLLDRLDSIESELDEKESIKDILNTTVDISCKEFGNYGECITVFDAGGSASSLPASAKIVDVGITFNSTEYKLSQLPSYNFRNSRHTIMSQINDCTSDMGRILFTLFSSTLTDAITQETTVHPIVESIKDESTGIFECKVYYTIGG